MVENELPTKMSEESKEFKASISDKEYEETKTRHRSVAQLERHGAEEKEGRLEFTPKQIENTRKMMEKELYGDNPPVGEKIIEAAQKFSQDVGEAYRVASEKMGPVLEKGKEVWGKAAQRIKNFSPREFIAQTGEVGVRFEEFKAKGQTEAVRRLRERRDEIYSQRQEILRLVEVGVEEAMVKERKVIGKSITDTTSQYHTWGRQVNEKYGNVAAEVTVQTVSHAYLERFQAANRRLPQGEDALDLAILNEIAAESGRDFGPQGERKARELAGLVVWKFAELSKLSDRPAQAEREFREGLLASESRKIEKLDKKLETMMANLSARTEVMNEQVYQAQTYRQTNNKLRRFLHLPLKYGAFGDEPLRLTERPVALEEIPPAPAEQERGEGRAGQPARRPPQAGRGRTPRPGQGRGGRRQ